MDQLLTVHVYRLLRTALNTCGSNSSSSFLTSLQSFLLRLLQRHTLRGQRFSNSHHYRYSNDHSLNVPPPDRITWHMRHKTVSLNSGSQSIGPVQWLESIDLSNCKLPNACSLNNKLYEHVTQNFDVPPISNQLFSNDAKMNARSLNMHVKFINELWAYRRACKHYFYLVRKNILWCYEHIFFMYVCTRYVSAPVNHQSHYNITMGFSVGGLYYLLSGRYTCNRMATGWQLLELHYTISGLMTFTVKSLSFNMLLTLEQRMASNL